MKKIILFLCIFAQVLQSHSDEIKGFLTNTLYSPEGRSIEIKLHKKIGDKIFVIGTQGELVIFPLSSPRQQYFKWYEKMLDPDDVNDFTVTKGLNVFLATEKGLYLYQPGQYEPKLFNDKLPRTKIIHIYSFGEKLFLLYPNRLILVKGKVWHEINIPNGKVLDDYQKFLVGVNGAKWVMGEKGIIRLDNKKGYIYSKRRPFKSYPEDAIISNKGGLFLRTDDNLIRWFDKDKKWFTLTHNSIPDGKIFIDPLSHIYLYDSDNLYFFKGGQFEPVHLPSSIADEEILGMYHNDFDRIYIVTSRSIVTVFTSSLTIDKVLHKNLPIYVANLRVGMSPFDGLMGKVFQNLHSYSDKQKDLYFRELADCGMEGKHLSGKLQQILTALPAKNRRKLQKDIKMALLQEEPDLAVYVQKNILKNITTPDEIINGYYDLAQIYRATKQKEFEQAVYEKVRNMFSSGPSSYGWMMLHLAMAHGDQEDNDYWDYLKKRTRDPILRTLVKEHNYEAFTQNQVLAKSNSSADVIQVSAPFRIKKLAADDNGVWLLGQNGKLRYMDSQSGQINNIRIRKSVAEIVSTNIGTIALLRNGYLNSITPDGLEKLKNYPPLNGTIQNIWSSMGMPVIKLKKYVFYFTNNKWNKFRLPSEIVNYHFIKALPVTGNIWLLVNPTKVYTLDITNGAIQGVQVPASVITIFDAEKNTSGGFNIATNDGLYQLLDGIWQKIDQRDGFWGDGVKSLAYVKKRNILFARTDSTIFLYLNGQWLTLPDSNYPAEQIALALDGTAYWSRDRIVYIWKRSNADETNMALEANKTAAFLYQHKKYENLVKYLSKLTSSKTMSQWAYEFLGRTYLQEKKYSSAYEQYYMGAKLNRNNPWITDSTFATLAWQLFTEGSWENALKCGQFAIKNYKQSKIRQYLFNFFFKKATSGILSNHLNDRLEILKWLKQSSGNALSVNELDRYINVLLILQYNNSFKKGKPDITLLRKAVQTFSNSPYVDLWNYYIIKTLVMNRQYEQSIKISDTVTSMMDKKSPILPFIGSLRFEADSQSKVR